MEVDLIEDITTIQFVLETDRTIAIESKVALQLVSDCGKYILQIHPKNFETLRGLLEKYFEGDTRAKSPFSISYRDEPIDRCFFCKSSSPSYIEIPTSINISPSNTELPSISSEQVQTNMCISCAEKLQEKLNYIATERKDILLAHEI